MQATTTNATRAKIALRRDALDRLRRDTGIDSEADLARRIGVNETTLWRVSRGDTEPSSGFIAAVIVAFPEASFAEVFRIDRPEDALVAPRAA